MRVATFGVVLFLGAFAIHWGLWRFRVPRRQTLALLLIFLGSLPAGLIVASVLPCCQEWRPVHHWETIQVAVFHIALALAFIVTYSLLEEHSPSLTLVKYVAEAGRRGRSRTELFALLEGAQSLPRRIHALLRDGLMIEVGGVYQLTPKGRGWARVFRSWQRLSHMEKGG
jgi:hypothetical protein